MEKRDTRIKPYKILIVDDDPLIIKTLERLLFRRNYLFFSVNSGEEAIEAIKESDADMILLDINMEGLSGIDVCNKLTSMGITQRIPVIFVTSRNQTNEIVEGFKAGAVDYILKPFNAEELLARIQTHLELRKAREEIRLMNLIKTRFFSIITHDIMDSLTGVRGVAGFLRDELQQTNTDLDEVKKLSGILHDDSNNLYHFVDNIIKWDRIESEENEPVPDEISMKEIVEDIVQSFSDQLANKKLAVNIEIGDQSGAYTSRAALNDILRELLANSIKFSENGGSILITAERKLQHTTLIIKDHGIGMDRDVAENVFRLDTPHPKTVGTNNEKGVGLGLIICHAWVKKLNGKISIASEKYKGAQVTVTLPDMEKSPITA